MDVLKGESVDDMVLLGTEWVDINNVYEFAKKLGIEVESSSK